VDAVEAMVAAQAAAGEVAWGVVREAASEEVTAVAMQVTEERAAAVMGAEGRGAAARAAARVAAVPEVERMAVVTAVVMVERRVAGSTGAATTAVLMVAVARATGMAEVVSGSAAGMADDRAAARVVRREGERVGGVEAVAVGLMAVGVEG
jgi:hypothetical protein